MNEKLRILKMIENGQISATEAANLLQAIDSGGSVSPTPPPPPPPPLPHSSEGRYDGYARNTRPEGSHSGVSFDDLGAKFESFAREAKPKVEKFAGGVAKTIAGAAERVSDAFTEATSSSHSHSQASSRPASPARSAPAGRTVEKQIEMTVEPGGHNELNISCMNGDIRVKGYNGDKITARLSYRAKVANAYIELVKLGGKYFLKYEPDDFTVVSIDAYVPERAFGVIKIDGINGALDASSLSANDMRFSNANGITVISALSARNISADSSNGRFTVSNIFAESASIENMNGTMDADELDVAKLKLSNYNSSLSILMSKFAKHSDYIWSVETGNAKLNINLPTAPDLGYHIKAHAAMSEIRIGLTGLQYLINEPSLVEARSVSFDKVAKKVKLAVETSNAPLLIN
ncbi:MAG: DUF4097 domain-containing protein [Clostridiales bacterium]|jgi:hypothetical protein|nr:DUF4097 domain-containing protein [Clostridiales bacterium]